VLVYGKYTLLQKEHPEVNAYTRELDGKKMLVVLNFSEKKTNINLKEAGAVKETLINNYDTINVKKTNILLLPYQGVVFALN
jgi:oligo-1,6-glucosidase